jgi:hypothetical protein
MSGNTTIRLDRVLLLFGDLGVLGMVSVLALLEDIGLTCIGMWSGDGIVVRPTNYS